MKVLLLNNGGYLHGLEKIEYPVKVAAEVDEDMPKCINVLGSELIRIGGSPDDYDPKYYYFFHEKEFKPA